MSMANIKDLLNEQDVKFYQQISLTNPLNPGMLELFKKMDAINKIYQKTKEGFTMVEMITLESKFSMKLNKIKIIDYEEKLFSIPKDYVRQDINQKQNNQIEAK
jgi:hypothetical protein